MAINDDYPLIAQVTNSVQTRCQVEDLYNSLTLLAGMLARWEFLYAERAQFDYHNARLLNLLRAFEHGDVETEDYREVYWKALDFYTMMRGQISATVRTLEKEGVISTYEDLCEQVGRID
jgi:hypothetical protein